MTNRTNNYIKSTILGFTALVLSSCVIQSPVVGTIGDETEHFTGTANRTFPSKSGVLSVVSNRGVACSGRFRYYKGERAGTGEFECTDGRMGMYDFTIVNNQGHGTGKTYQGEFVEFYFNHKN